ncbi:MAG: TIGR01212 family radical SAM protein [Tissierellia bacterium]|nr:TIGR01212 family radical SAM protein [Tissierellia bacterium]
MSTTKKNKKPYYRYSDFLRDRFGQKVYKLPIKLAGTCPNRDGTLAWGGCIFCGEEGGSFENLESGTIKDQLRENRERMGRRYKAKKFIAYFQNFTNTYLPLETFKANIQAVLEEDIVGINISTRPDCLPEAYLDFLGQLTKDYMVTLELGLQSTKDETLRRINRGHDLAAFIDAVLRAHQHGIRVCAHMILDLPWDSLEDAISSARILSALRVEEVKLHNLYLVKGTPMEALYKAGKIQLLSKADYQERVISFLEHLDPKIVVARIVGRAPEAEVTHANWDNSWWKIHDEINEIMVSSNRLQGGLFNKEFSMLRKDD